VDYDGKPPVRGNGKVRPRRGQHVEGAMHCSRVKRAIVRVSAWTGK